MKKALRAMFSFLLILSMAAVYLPSVQAEGEAAERTEETIMRDTVENNGEIQTQDGALTIVEHKTKGIGTTYFTYHYLGSDGKYYPVNKTLTLWTSICSFFTLSDGSTAYCVNPNRPGQTGGDVYETDWMSYHTPEIREAIAVALAYGAPNNGDTSDEGRWATALLVWDMGCGYIDQYGQTRRDGNGNRKTPPFGAAASGTVRTKYREILTQIQNHNKIPSFAVRKTEELAQATYTLEKAQNGNYMLTLTDTNEILEDFEYASDISGLSFSRSGNVLTITATPEAAYALAAGATFSAVGQTYMPSGSGIICLRSEYWQDQEGARTQDIARLTQPVAKTPAYIRLKTDVQVGYDPAELEFRKTDPISGDPQGDSSFAHAVFLWEYFPNENWAGDPERKWYFETDENGFHSYTEVFISKNDQYLSDPLYRDPSGKTSIPLGTVRVTEVRAPKGYGTIPPLFAAVRMNPVSGKTEFVWTHDSQITVDSQNGNYLLPEPQDTTSFGGIEIRKVDASTGGAAADGTTFAGIRFGVYNLSANPVIVNDTVIGVGEKVLDLLIGEDGLASTGRILPIGTYRVIEEEGNAFYEVNSDWVRDLQVTGDGQILSVICEDEIRCGSISVRKADRTGRPLQGAVFLLEWYDELRGTWRAVFRSDCIVPGGSASDGLENGTLTTGADGTVTWNGLYTGLRYRITETRAPAGFQLLEGYAYEGVLPAEDPRIEIRVTDQPVYELPMTGAASLGRTAAAGVIALAACVSALLYLRKKERGQ